MPRDAVVVTDVTAAGVANPAGTTINTTNGANIAGPLDRRILVRITNTNGTNRVATIKASTANPPAVRTSIGDLALTVPATTGDTLVVLETSRFVKQDGSIDVDFAASFAGIISAVRLPKGV